MKCFLCCRYAAGTTPWGSGSSSASFLPQRIDDGYLEVIGFTTASLVSGIDSSVCMNKASVNFLGCDLVVSSCQCFHAVVWATGRASGL